ncbi:hypothetical protein GY50_1403 [Dehalococcoides mccartyi GY50]|nr:hypothetical protein GY50_1403 [Dehalococcoides mccartyi GY50]
MVIPMRGNLFPRFFISQFLLDVEMGFLNNSNSPSSYLRMDAPAFKSEGMILDLVETGGEGENIPETR